MTSLTIIRHLLCPRSLPATYVTCDLLRPRSLHAIKGHLQPSVVRNRCPQLTVVRNKCCVQSSPATGVIVNSHRRLWTIIVTVNYRPSPSSVCRPRLICWVQFLAYHGLFSRMWLLHLPWLLRQPQFACLPQCALPTMDALLTVIYNSGLAITVTELLTIASHLWLAQSAIFTQLTAFNPTKSSLHCLVLQCLPLSLVGPCSGQCWELWPHGWRKAQVWTESTSATPATAWGVRCGHAAGRGATSCMI